MAPDNRGTVWPGAENRQRSRPGTAAASPPPRPPPLSKLGKSSQFITQADPWTKYRRFFEEEQAGHTILAHAKRPTFDVVAVKKKELANGDNITRLRSTHHPNIVNLMKVYQHEATVFLIYEDMDLLHVSVSDIYNSPAQPLKHAEIASICKQVSIFPAKDVLITHYESDDPWVVLHTHGLEDQSWQCQ